MRSLSNCKFPDCLHFFGARARQVWRDKSCHIRTHEKNSRDAVCRLRTIIQSIFWAQSGGSICLTIWKWSSETGYPGALPPVLENFYRAYVSPKLTDCPWVSKEAQNGMWTRNVLVPQSKTPITVWLFHKIIGHLRKKPQEILTLFSWRNLFTIIEAKSKCQSEEWLIEWNGHNSN